MKMERLSIEEIKEILNRDWNEMKAGYFCINDFRAIEQSMELLNELKAYKDAEEQGLLLRLPCHYNDTLYWIVDGAIREVWFKGIRCDKGYKPQIIARHMGQNFGVSESPISNLENLGETVFLTREDAKQALAEMLKKENTNTDFTEERD